MKSAASRIALVLSGVVLLAAVVLLSAGRLEYCGQPAALRPRIDVASAAGACRPTLAPPQNVVFVRVEADKPGLEIGWAEN